MRIFVTGGTGFVGSHLVEALMERGDDVVCLARNPAKAVSVFGDKIPHIVRGSLQDTKALAEGCTGADAVFHVAGLTAARNRSEFFVVNSNATRTLMHVAKREAPRLSHVVYVSSIAASGPTTKGAPLAEDAPSKPVSNYGWSKLAGEEAVRSSGLPWTIVRPPTVYGPRDAEILKVFKLAKMSLAPVFGDGSQELSLIYAPDLAAALVACMRVEAVEKTLFASHPEIRTAREVAAEAHIALGRSGKSAGGPRYLTIGPTTARAALWLTGLTARLVRRRTVLSADKANEFLAEAWTCSSEAITRTTGWQATTTLVEGFRHTVKWYREAGWL